MANPLTLFVPIKQDDKTQQDARSAAALFPLLVGGGLKKAKNVHYARLVLLHQNPFDTTTPVHALILITEFDKDMETYLDIFWTTSEGITDAFMGLYKMMIDELKDPKDPKPEDFEFPDFVKFITSKNLTNDITKNWSAYPQLVTDIWKAYPPKD